MKKYLSVILSATIIMSTFLTSGIQVNAATSTNVAAATNANLLNTYGKVFGKVGTTLNASQISDSNAINATKKKLIQ